MIQVINCPGRLKVGVKVLLCFTYKKAIVLFSGLQLSTQAKRCEMRTHPASKQTEGGRARLGRVVHVVSIYSKIEID